jgi:hypothetical protein
VAALAAHPETMEKNARFKAVAAAVGRTKTECWAAAKAL